MRKRMITLALSSVLTTALFLAGCGDDKTPEAAPADVATEVEDTEAEIEAMLDDIIENAGETSIAEEVPEPEEEEEEECADRRTDLQKYWNGDWYGFMIIHNATGSYEPNKGNGYDCFSRIMIDEEGNGDMVLWYGYDGASSADNPSGDIKINVSEEAGFGPNGAAISTGGWLMADTPEGAVEEMDFLIDPDDNDFSDSLYFEFEYEDKGGTMTILYGLRPWGNRWVEEEEKTLTNTMHAFTQWYLPLIDGGWAMPDAYGLEGTKTMEEREQELIDAAAGQPIPKKEDSGSSSDDADTSSTDSSDSSDDSSGSSAGGDSIDIGNATITGQPYTWGNITVNIPDGMTETDGNVGNPKDKDAMWIQNSSNSMYYLLVTVAIDESNAETNTQMSKSANNGKDVEVTVNGVKWKGIYYDYSGKPCWQIYANIDGTVFQVNAFNYAFDSTEAQTVLGSVKHS